MEPTHWKRRKRWAASSEALDAAEREWWERYADVEDEFCWVQTPTIQRFLRGSYVASLISAIPPGSRVLEIGCGTGWLARALAQSGAAEVHGVEFSPEQIARARQQTAGVSGGERVHFHVIKSSLEELPALFSGRLFDVLVVHAVLHHLSDEELRELALLFRDRLAAPAASALILEPVLFREPGAGALWLEILVDRLILIPRLGVRSGLRTISKREALLLRRIDERGDSPKETPFLPGELEELLAPTFRVRQQTPVLCFSFLAAKNLLLFRISHPVLGGLLAWPYLWAVRSLERLVLNQRPGAVWYPLFYLFRCDLTLPAGSPAE